MKNKPYKGKHVLILEGYCKQCLPFIHSFKKHGCEVSILCNSKLDCGYVSLLPDHRILGICDFDKPKESEEYIVNLIKSGNYDLVFPLFDFSARILANNKELLSQYAFIYANDKDVFDLANDKYAVMQHCMNNEIPCPHTLFDIKSIEDVREKNPTFPLIIKPKRMYGARGYHSFNTFESLSIYVESKSIDLSEYVIQEMIPLGSKVMGANVFIDKNGNVKSNYLYVCEHVYPENGGTSTLNAILDRPDIQKYCEDLAKSLRLRGIIGIDLMLDNRDYLGKVIEINVRPVHGITIGFMCGVDHALQVLEDAFGPTVSEMKINDFNTCVRITQTDVLWFIKSKNRFNSTPKKMGYKHTKDQMFYWNDPLPWFAYLLEGLMSYKTKMEEKTQ